VNISIALFKEIERFLKRSRQNPQNHEKNSSAPAARCGNKNLATFKANVVGSQFVYYLII